MTFEMKHQIFKKARVETFEHGYPPSWLLSREFKWFYHEHVMKLKVGESIKSDFREFTRIK